MGAWCACCARTHLVGVNNRPARSFPSRSIHILHKPAVSLVDRPFVIFVIFTPVVVVVVLVLQSHVVVVVALDNERGALVWSTRRPRGQHGTCPTHRAHAASTSALPVSWITRTSRACATREGPINGPPACLGLPAALSNRSQRFALLVEGDGQTACGVAADATGSHPVGATVGGWLVG